jgi:cytoskeleton protein RodZ
MTSVGDVLRNARDQQGRTIAKVAEELCITQGYVRAMEEDDLKNLPGIFFYKSFVRQYAALLSVDGSLIAPALAALTPREEVPTRQQTKPAPLFPLDPIVEYTNRFCFSGNPLGLSVAGLMVALALCSGFYAWWSRAPQATIPAVRPTSTVTSPAAAQSSVPSTTHAITRSTAAPTPGESAQVVAVSQAPSADQPSEATDADGLEHVVLSLSATERTWLRITSDGRTIFSGVLQPSESKVLKGSDMATMKVGNAAGIDVRLNGKPIGPLGQRGQVRTVRFTHANFEILPPTDKVEPSAETKSL